jgi:hypothetical protein
MMSSLTMLEVHILIFDLILIYCTSLPRVGGAGHQSVVSNSYAYGDYYSDLESFNEDKPPNRYILEPA